MIRQDDWTGWTAGAFEAAGPSGTTTMAGWLRGPFAMDFRPTNDGNPQVLTPFAWVVTHLPTGWAMFAVQGSAAEARAVVTDVEPWTDWQAMTLEASPFMGKRVREYSEANPGLLIPGSLTINPGVCWNGDGSRPTFDELLAGAGW